MNYFFLQYEQRKLCTGRAVAPAIAIPNESATLATPMENSLYFCSTCIQGNEQNQPQEYSKSCRVHDTANKTGL